MPLRWVAGVDAALAVGDLATAERLVDSLGRVRSGLTSPSMRAELARGRARLAMARGEQPGVEGLLRGAVERLDALGARPAAAAARLDLADHLEREGRAGDAAEVLAEAAALAGPFRAATTSRRTGSAANLRA